MKLKPFHHRQPCLHTQKGAALAISLIMLLLLTIIGVTAMQSTTMQERMAGNSRERNNAFQIAEAALRVAETYLVNNLNPTFVDSSTTDSANGLYFENTTASNAWYLTQTSNNAKAATRNTGDDTIYGDATYGYVIEELEPVTSEDLSANAPVTNQHYRITARGTGPAGTAVVLLQSTYKR